MKFAVVALIAAVAAKPPKGRRPREEELTENVKAHYSAGAVKKFFGLMKEMEQNDREWEAAFNKEHPHFEQKMEKLGNWAGERYGPEFMAWAQVPKVQASEAHKKKVFHESKELHEVMKDGFDLYQEFANGKVEMGYGFNKDGSYSEWMSNESARHVFEELYELAKDVRTFVESPMAVNQRRLERETLKDPHFHKLFKMVQDDLDIHTWGQFETRTKQLMKRVGTELKNCPYFQKFMGILMRMKALCESERQVSDLGTPEEWTNWWNSKKFTNPFEGMKMEPMFI